MHVLRHERAPFWPAGANGPVRLAGGPEAIRPGLTRIVKDPRRPGATLAGISQPGVITALCGGETTNLKAMGGPTGGCPASAVFRLCWPYAIRNLSAKKDDGSRDLFRLGPFGPGLVARLDGGSVMLSNTPTAQQLQGVFSSYSPSTRKCGSCKVLWRSTENNGRRHE